MDEIDFNFMKLFAKKHNKIFIVSNKSCIILQVPEVFVVTTNEH